MRTALGAQASHIITLVVGDALVVVGAGFAVGLVLALVLGRLVSGFLYGVGPHDAGTFAAVAALMGLVCSVASLEPVRRAIRVDPIVALRTE